MSEAILKEAGMFRWHVPGAEADEAALVAGELEIDANGISTLSLVGLMPVGKSAGDAFGIKPIDADQYIIGALKDNRHVVLRHIIRGGTTFSNVLSHQKYKARQAIVFNRLSEFPQLDAVTKLQIALNGLGEWASEPVVILKKTKRGPTAYASTPKVKEFKLSDKTVFLKTRVSYTALTDTPLQSATIKQETFLEVEPSTPRSLVEMRGEFHLIEDLLLLMSDIDVTLPWPTVHFGDQAGVFYFERRRQGTQDVDKLKSWAWLTMACVNFGTLLAELEAQRDILGPALYLYLGIRRSPALYLENKFSTAIFGLESLDRRTAPSKLVPSKFDEKITRIINDVKLQKDRTWLEGRLKHASEPNLEERLSRTFAELKIDIEATSLRTFSKKCADLRNDIAHFGGQREGDYDGFVKKIHTFNEAVRPLYHAVLLNRIGLDHDCIQAYFHRSPYSDQRKRSMAAAGLIFTARTAPSSEPDSDPEQASKSAA